MKLNINDLLGKARLLSPNAVTGLDIGAYSIKLVQASAVNGTLQITKAAYKPLPVVGDKGMDIKEEDITATIRQLFAEAGVRSRNVRLAISESSLYTRQITIPRIDEEELKKGIKWQAEKYIPFAVDEAIVDFQIIESTATKKDEMDVFIVAAKSELVSKYIFLLKEAGLTPTVLDITPLANAKAYLKCYTQQSDPIVLLIDIGAKVTSTVVLRGSTVLFVRNFEVAGNHLTQAIMEARKIKWADAEKVKMELAVPLSDESKVADGPNTYLAVEPVIADLVSQIRRSLVYCERDFVLEDIKQAVLCGGGALLKNLDQYLSKQLNLSFVLADPLAQISTLPEVKDNAQKADLSPKLMGAVGSTLTLN